MEAEGLGFATLRRWLCVAVDRGGGAVPEESSDSDGHLRGTAGGGHRVCGRLLQNQVSTTAGRDQPPLWSREEGSGHYGSGLMAGTLQV